MNWSLESYEEVIQFALDSNYECLPFNSIQIESANRKVFLRHDIDFSMEFALDIAHLEESIGVNSSFYILISSYSYNFLEQNNLVILRQIREMGHEVGIHLDSRILTGANANRCSEILDSIYSIFPNIFNSNSFSMHNPVIEDLDFEISGYKNCYGLMTLDNWEYVSDSNRNFRGKDILDLMRQGRNIQFLSHPIWWVSKETDWIKVHHDVIERRAKASWTKLQIESPSFFTDANRQTP